MMKKLKKNFMPILTIFITLIATKLQLSFQFLNKNKISIIIHLKKDPISYLKKKKMSFESFLENISFAKEFILNLNDFTKKLKEDEYSILLEFIKKNFVSGINFNPEQESDFSESVFKETINEELKRNKIFEDYLKSELPTWRPKRSDYEIEENYYEDEYLRKITIDLREYTEELTENHFKRLCDYIENDYFTEELYFTIEQQIQFNKSEFKDRILDQINLHKAQNHGEPLNYWPDRPIAPRENYLRKPKIYILRKGWIELKMKENNEVDEEYEYKFYKKKISELRNPCLKIILFNLNHKPDNNKRIQNQAKKLIIDSELSSIWDESLINDYYALKGTKRINFKE